MTDRKKSELFYFRNKTERTIFYILVVIALIIFATGIYFYLISDPEALKVQGIALLVTIACGYINRITPDEICNTFADYEAKRKKKMA